MQRKERVRNRPARNSTRAIRPAPRRGVGWRKQKSKARSGRVPRRGRRNFGLGTGPLRDRPRTGFRSGHLRKRDIPHTVSLMPCGLGRSPCPHRARDASGSGCPTGASRDASHAALAGWVRGLWGRRRARGLLFSMRGRPARRRRVAVRSKKSGGKFFRIMQSSNKWVQFFAMYERAKLSSFTALAAPAYPGNMVEAEYPRL